MGVRNVVSHLGQQDIEQPMAERALNTMELLCKEIDTDGANELHEIYKVVRARAKEPSAGYVGAAQPLTNPDKVNHLLSHQLSAIHIPIYFLCLQSVS